VGAYNPQTYETTIIPAKVGGTDFVVYKLLVDNRGRLWGSLIPTNAFAGKKFPVLSIFNESTKQFELTKGMLSQYPQIFNVLTPTRCARFPLSMQWRGG
jgi:hypothetical protein